jgi:hypothetical protein
MSNRRRMSIKIDIKNAIKRATKAKRVVLHFFPELVVAIADDTSYVAWVIGDDDELAFRSGDGATIICPLNNGEKSDGDERA